MAVNASLLLIASITGALGSAQEPTFDMQLAAPEIGVSAPQQQLPTESTVADPVPAALAPVDLSVTIAESFQEPHVTMSFHNTPVKDVLKWLESKGVSFVVSDADVANEELTLNLLDQPMDSVVEAIGSALDGRFVKRDNVYVFERGPWQSGSLLPGVSGQGSVSTLRIRPDLRFRVSRDGGAARAFTIAPGAEGAGVRPLIVQGEEMNANHRQAMVELRKALEQLRSMKQIGPDTEKLSTEARKEIEAAMVEMERAMSQLRSSLKSFNWSDSGGKVAPREFTIPDMKSFNMPDVKFFSMPDIKFDAKQQQAFAKQMEAWAKEQKELAKKDGMAGRNGQWKSFTAPVVTFGRQNLSALLESLTPEQKAKQKEQGYLMLSDLTQAQRRMLGEVGDGKFEIRYKSDQGELVIKN